MKLAAVALHQHAGPRQRHAVARTFSVMFRGRIKERTPAGTGTGAVAADVAADVVNLETHRMGGGAHHHADAPVAATGPVAQGIVDDGAERLGQFGDVAVDVDIIADLLHIHRGPT